MLGGVVVHCNAGVSRSSSVVLAAVMRSEGWSLQHAYTHLKQTRPAIQPNKGFMRQLKLYEQSLLSGTNHVQ